MYTPQCVFFLYTPQCVHFCLYTHCVCFVYTQCDVYVCARTHTHIYKHTQIYTPLQHQQHTGDAGNVHLVSLTSRQSIATLTHSGSVRSATFSQDGTTLYTAGSDGVLYAWDLRTRRCLARGVDEGCLNSSALAASPLGDVLATASSSGVVNMYDTADLSWGVPKTTAAAHTTSALPPVSKPTRRPTTTVIHPAPRLQPTKTLMHLTTTIDTLTFSPSGEMMAFGSRMERDALKVLHVPSKTVFSNWPTTRSPLGYVHCVGFSPGGGLMAVGNAKGRVLLYRVHHYAEA